jgi:hypothetical protein
MAKQRVVVKGDLGIESDELAVFGDDQRVDLSHAAVVLHEEAADLREKLFGAADGRGVEAQSIRQFSSLIGVEPGDGVEGLFQDFFGRMFGDFFDFNAAFGRHDEHRATGFAVNDDAQIQFAGDLKALFDKQSVDLLALRAGLNGDKSAVEHSLGILTGFFGRANKNHTPLLRILFKGAFAPATRVDLGFDNSERPAECFEGGRGLFRGFSHNALRHGNAGGAEKLFALVFVNFHDHPSLQMNVGAVLELAAAITRVSSIPTAWSPFDHSRVFRGFFAMNSGESDIRKRLTRMQAESGAVACPSNQGVCRNRCT